MHYLSADEIAAINEVVIEETSGSLGIREPGMLLSIAAKPRTEFDGAELYPDIFAKAAALYEAVVNYHVFVDGNKRTGLATAGRFLALNGYDLTATDTELEKYTLHIATTNPNLTEIAEWLKEHSLKSS